MTELWLAALTPDLVLGLFLLAVLALLELAEGAIFGPYALDRRPLVEAGNGRLAALVPHAERVQGALLLGSEAARALLAAVGAALLIAAAPGRAWLNVLLVPLVAVVLAELIPWHLGRSFHSRLGPALAPLARGLGLLLWPLLAGLNALTGAGRRAAAPEPVVADSKEEPLRELLDQGVQSGMLRAIEQDLINRVLSFRELTVGRLMTPRREMVSVSLDLPWPALLAALREAGYSRVPVWEGSPENVVGVLLVKDLLPPLVQASAGLELAWSSRQLRRLLRPARYVPSTRRAADMLAEFRAQRLHLALVVDEHGTVVGLITLDDLLGELVGELPDETDEEPEPLLRPDGAGSWLVLGSMDAADFAERFGLTLPEGDFHTVGGLVVKQLGDLAHEGDRVVLDDAVLMVRRVEGRRITELLLTLSPNTPPTGLPENDT